MTGAATADRLPRPKAGEPRPYQFPRFERAVLPKGMKLLVAPISKLPIVTISVLADAGAVADPPERSGLAQLTARLLLEGTTSPDGTAITDRFERLGASIDSHADWDVAAVNVTTLTDKLAESFDLLGAVLRRPGFNEREVERLKAERLAELLQQRAEPRGLADELFSRFLYDSRSRYALPDGGDETSVRGLTRAEVVRFYEARYSPASMTMIVAGDIEMRVLERMAAAVFGDWTGPLTTPASASDDPARRNRALHIVNKPDAPQSDHTSETSAPIGEACGRRRKDRPDGAHG